MKIILLLAGFYLFPAWAGAQNTGTLSRQADPAKKILIVEASCGQCQFGLPGKGCRLAVRIDGHAYFVKGTEIDAYGDAHADDGFCEAIRTAEVQGEVKDSLFELTYFKLKPKIPIDKIVK